MNHDKDSFIEALHIEDNIIPQYVRIRKDPNPIFIWGAGALAARVCHYCKNYNINVKGIFVNTGTIDSERYFMNFPVFDINELLGNYPQISVIIGHSNYLKGIAYLSKISNVASVYCLASLAYDIWDPVPIDFLYQHSARLDDFYNVLDDEKSRECLKTYFESRINDRAEYMLSLSDEEIDYYKNDIVPLSEDNILLDVGACVGNAIWPFVDAVKGKYCRIIALEPDDDNYEILRKNVENRHIQNIMTVKACAYNEDGKVRFVGCSEGGGIGDTGENLRYKPALKIDSLFNKMNLAPNNLIIKINFPFSVCEVLQGAEATILKKHPTIIIRAGFDENVLLAVYKEIIRIDPTYKLHLRYTVGIPQGLTIFCV